VRGRLLPHLRRHLRGCVGLSRTVTVAESLYDNQYCFSAVCAAVNMSTSVVCMSASDSVPTACIAGYYPSGSTCAGIGSLTVLAHCVAAIRPCGTGEEWWPLNLLLPGITHHLQTSLLMRFSMSGSHQRGGRHVHQQHGQQGDQLRAGLLSRQWSVHRCVRERSFNRMISRRYLHTCCWVANQHASRIFMQPAHLCLSPRTSRAPMAATACRSSASAWRTCSPVTASVCTMV
jgi:hypothetical protein